MELLTVPSSEQVVATPDGQLRKIDAGVCVRFRAGQRETTFSYQDVDLYDARALFRRVEMLCVLHLASPGFRDEAENVDLGLETDQKVCIRYDHWSRQVRYTRIGLDYHEAAVACAQAAAMCDHLLMHVHGQMDGRTEEL